MAVAIVGGTGPQGSGLAVRLALAGEHVMLGSRDAGRAIEKAAELTEKWDLPGKIEGADNEAAISGAETVLLVVPYTGHAELVASLAEALTDKIVVSCVNPLVFDKQGPIGITVEAGSAAEEAAALLPNSKVTGAFHHLSAVNLHRVGTDLSAEDVLVCGDDGIAVEQVRLLAEKVTGGRSIDAGPLRIARHLEPFTAVLISVNKKYKVHSSISLTGLNK